MCFGGPIRLALVSLVCLRAAGFYCCECVEHACLKDLWRVSPCFTPFMPELQGSVPGHQHRHQVPEEHSGIHAVRQGPAGMLQSNCRCTPLHTFGGWCSTITSFLALDILSFVDVRLTALNKFPITTPVVCATLFFFAHPPPPTPVLRRC
jgi:hypothetical protein